MESLAHEELDDLHSVVTPAGLDDDEDLFAFDDETSNREILDSLTAQMERARAEREEHKKTCIATICDPCERHGCEQCGTRIANRGKCLRCLVDDEKVAAGIPSRYRDADRHLASRVRSISARAQIFTNIDARVRVHRGPTGSGKTSGLCALFAECVRQDIVAGRTPIQTLFVGALDLELARAQHRLGDGEAPLVEEAMDVELLILDDVGAESARGVDALIAVLHRRHNEQRRTWLSLALSAAEVCAKFGGGFERRVFEHAHIVDFGGPR